LPPRIRRKGERVYSDDVGVPRVDALSHLLRSPEGVIRTTLSRLQAPVMKIHFPHERPEYRARDLVVVFPAEVDGTRIECAITAEALEDHFGARSLREDDLNAAFDAHRHQIHEAARNLLKEVGPKPLMMHSGYFRFCE
jgi:hypothetical protein